MPRLSFDALRRSRDQPQSTKPADRPRSAPDQPTPIDQTGQPAPDQRTSIDRGGTDRDRIKANNRRIFALERALRASQPEDQTSRTNATPDDQPVATTQRETCRTNATAERPQRAVVPTRDADRPPWSDASIAAALPTVLAKMHTFVTKHAPEVQPHAESAQPPLNPIVAAKPLTITVASYDGYCYALLFSYDAALVAALKAVLAQNRLPGNGPAGGWRPNERCWVVETHAAEAVFTYLRACGYRLQAKKQRSTDAKSGVSSPA